MRAFGEIDQLAAIQRDFGGRRSGDLAPNSQ
jgi:hypothetical protein